MSTTDNYQSFQKWWSETGHDAVWQNNEEDSAWEVWQAATEAAKATGTAGELPKLPKPVGAVEHCPSKREIKIEAAFTADQMREYARAVIAATNRSQP